MNQRLMSIIEITIGFLGVLGVSLIAYAGTKELDDIQEDRDDGNTD